MIERCTLLAASIIFFSCKPSPLPSVAPTPPAVDAAADVSSIAEPTAAIPPAADPQSVFQIDNVISACVDLIVEDESKKIGFLDLHLRIFVRENTGTCGCKSAQIRYHILRPTADPFNMQQLATKAFNTLHASERPFEGRHRVRVKPHQLPLRVQLSCGG